MAENSTNEQLVSAGFELISRWWLKGDTIKPETLDWRDTSGWIYAFVTGNKIRYVGITTMVLRSRLDCYSYQQGDRVRDLIRAALSAGQTVEIYGLRRPGVPKSILEVEESAYMKAFAVDWNVRE